MISPETLRRYTCFAGLSEQSLKQIAMIGEEKRVPAGQCMFQQGDPATHLYVICQGEVSIQYMLGDGTLCTVDTLVDGDLLVWSALIEPYKMTAIGTTTKDTRLVAIDAPKLRALCGTDPLVGYRLTTQVAKMLAHRLENARLQLAATG
jgi:CRP/FNR family transcriptional regulator, cyclic AMP receptor protein